MNTQLEEYNLSPINEAILQERLLHVSELHHNIEATKQVFQQYIQLGNQMCKNIQDLAHTFESCTGGDSSLKPIVTLLNVFQNAMTSHYRQVEDKVISPLTKFVNTEIKKAESDGNEATKQYDDFSKILDGYVSVPSKKRTEKSFEGKENQLLFQNWMAINKNFTFVRSLDLVERKKTIEITAAVCFI
ncbi:hypothetical protein TRFO_24920 [Tritrichomonas foetus]|uniref:BAR domain-containing protein n=1 Tax=Tritrichomonas foetus TaxID=1144522 RepID=A0A1J4K673_9EUKA|nr:hypothetical protein TRFO_24920 [Tritrichomonas foetus]|eukprot:OHT06953.1 hypothetical protein TRFO_24920 [Tritrichomonas foetus]